MVDRVSSTYQPLGASLEFRYLTESEQDLSLVERQEQLHNEPPEISACHLSNKDSPAISQETPLPSFQNAYGVLRVDVTRPTGTPAHLWVVSVTRHGRVYNRNFNDAVYGNKESACSWRWHTAMHSCASFLPTRGWNAAHRSIPATPRALLVCLQGTTKNTSKAGQPC